MKKLIAVLMLFIFVAACSSSSESVQDVVNIQQIEMFQQNDVTIDIIPLGYEILYTEAGETYIFNRHESRRVEVDGIMYLYEVTLLGGGAGAVPCTQTMYDNAIGKEQIFEKSFDLISYYKEGKNGVMYHKEVFYKDVSKNTVGKQLAILQ